MKHMTIANNAMRLLIASFVLFSFSNCTKSDIREESELGINETSKAQAKNMNPKKEYRAVLSSLNNSGASGTATLWLEGDKLTVTIEAMGLEANKVHPQHIHGFTEDNRNSTCPTMAADTNGDGLVDLVEGLPSYGPVLLTLTPLPTADASGRITYTQTFTVTKDLLPLQNRAIVLHGLTVMGEYWPTLPVACGQIKSWNSNGLVNN